MRLRSRNLRREVPLSLLSCGITKLSCAFPAKWLFLSCRGHRPHVHLSHVDRSCIPNWVCFGYFGRCRTLHQAAAGLRAKDLLGSFSLAQLPWKWSQKP